MQHDWKTVPFGGKKKIGKGDKEVPSCRATYHGADGKVEYTATTSTGDSDPHRFAPGEVAELLRSIGIIEINAVKTGASAMYSCAEARAVAGLIRKAKLTESDAQKISLVTLSTAGVWVPCPNCIQWLTQGDNGHYWIKPSFPSL